MISARQENFCREYSIDRNGTAAAIRAGYSKAAASQQASRMLANVNIKTRIAQLLDDSAKRQGATLDRVMGELATIAFANMSDFGSWESDSFTLRSSEQLSPEQLKAVESVAETSSKTGEPQLRIRLHSKLRALELLLRIHEMKEIEARLSAIEEALKKR
jgi:phage terminase small subunit